MRIDRVEAAAFGPFVDEQLELAAGMTVVHGPNESGKSSWHAAIYAGLCGMRRARGAGLKQDRQFAERHRPWDGDRWRVGVGLTLDDGRQVEVSQDLAGQVDCRATDTVLGADLSDEIMVEGAPDGAAFLGLTRKTLPSTLCIRQADLLGVLDDATELQEAVQRAAATGGTDATAEQALSRIARFRKEQVGTERANANKPLMTAVRAHRAAATELQTAREAHAEYLALTVEHTRAQHTACEARATLDEVRAVAAAREVDELAARVAEARAIWDVFDGTAPASISANDALDRQVAEALSAHRNRPTPGQQLDGPSSTELEAELASLPDTPSGDLAPHDSVVTARRRWERATDAVRAHPPAASVTAEEPQTGEAGATGQPTRSAHPGLLGGAGLLLLVAVVAGVLGQAALAGILAVIGVVLGGVGLRGTTAGSTRAGEPQAVDTELAQRRRAEWQQTLDTRKQEASRAADDLRAALQARGHDTEEGDLATAVAAYEAACAERSRTAAAAARREGLVAQLSARRAAEHSAEERQRLHDRADTLLVDAAAAAGVAAREPMAAAAALTAWQADREAKWQEAVEADRRWQRLQFLLDGQELGELEAALATRRAALPARNGSEMHVEDDLPAQLARLEKAVRDADRHADELAGSVADRRAHLPSVAEAEEELERAKAEEARLRALDATLETTHQFLSEAKDRVHRDIAPRLQASVAARLPAITAGRYEAVTVDPASLEVKVREAGGTWRAATLLSHGTAEQVYLLLRLALVEHLCTTGETAPLLLDDVTVQADRDRTQGILELLHDISAERQVVLFSQEDDVLDWAEQQLRAPQDALIACKPVQAR